MTTAHKDLPALPKWIDDLKGADPTTDAVIEYIEGLLAALARPEPASAPVVVEPSYWMVESVSGCGWWDGRFLSRDVDPRFFSLDPNECVRFARKEDAERVASQSSSLKATEHIWHAQAAFQGQQSAGAVDEWAEYLREGETPIQRLRREIKDSDTLVGMLAKGKAKAGPVQEAGCKVKLVKVAVPADEFENAIRRFGVVAACEWFDHGPDSEFTKETIHVLEQRANGKAPE